MDTQKMKLGAGLVAGAIALAVGGYAAGSWMTKPELVAVTSTGCGSIETAGSFGLPLRTVGLSAPAIAVSFGPVDYPTGGGGIRLAFERQVEGGGREVVLVGDTLRLPMTFGRDNLSPERITVTCRNGDIATVRYNRGRSGTTFNVVRQEISEAGEEAQPVSES